MLFFIIFTIRLKAIIIDQISNISYVIKIIQADIDISNGNIHVLGIVYWLYGHGDKFVIVCLRGIAISIKTVIMSWCYWFALTQFRINICSFFVDVFKLVLYFYFVSFILQVFLIFFIRLFIKDYVFFGLGFFIFINIFGLIGIISCILSIMMILYSIMHLIFLISIQFKTIIFTHVSMRIKLQK